MSTLTAPVIDAISDAMINRRVIEQHPELRSALIRPTTQCVYDGVPSSVVVTGDLGQRLGLCAACDTRNRVHAPVDLPDGAREHPDEDAQYLAVLTRECERLSLALQLTDDPAVDLPELHTIDGVRTLLARADELGVALDEVRCFARDRDRCIDCKTPVDNTMTPYAPGYDHMDGTPIMICRACRDKRTALANDPDRLAFSRALDAIEAVFKASENPEMTRQALREFVDMTAARLRAPAGGAR